MPRGRTAYDPTTLKMALVGYEIEKQKLEEKIGELRMQLARRGTGALGKLSNTAATGTRPRRRLSASARKRIADAQRKRWAAHRKKLAQGAKAS